jgi:hypothetical protein
MQGVGVTYGIQASSECMPKNTKGSWVSQPFVVFKVKNE